MKLSWIIKLILMFAGLACINAYGHCSGKYINVTCKHIKTIECSDNCKVNAKCPADPIFCTNYKFIYYNPKPPIRSPACNRGSTTPKGCEIGEFTPDGTRAMGHIREACGVKPEQAPKWHYFHGETRLTPTNICSIKFA